MALLRAAILPLLYCFISNILGGFLIYQTTRSGGHVCQGGGPHSDVGRHCAMRGLSSPLVGAMPWMGPGWAVQRAGHLGLRCPGSRAFPIAAGSCSREAGSEPRYPAGSSEHAAASMALHRCCWCGARRGPGAPRLAAPRWRHLPRAWRRKPPPALLLPSALPRKRLRAGRSPALVLFSIKTKRYPLFGEERGGRLSVGGLRPPPPPVPIAAPRGPASPARLLPSLPPACPGRGFGAGGAAPTPPGAGAERCRRERCLGSPGLQPGPGCAGGAGFFVGCRVTGSH